MTSTEIIFRPPDSTGDIAGHDLTDVGGVTFVDAARIIASWLLSYPGLRRDPAVAVVRGAGQPA